MSRGIVFGEFTARYGETVRVYGSSGSSCPQCWISLNSAVDKNDQMGGERIEASALLTVRQARLLIGALENFIDAEAES